MRKLITAIITLIPFVCFAQEAQEFSPEAQASEADSIAVQNLLSGFRAKVAFSKGAGVPIDTLDVGDDKIMVVLCDDNSWFFIRNLDKLAADSTFTEHWIEDVPNAYADVTLESLPYHNTIVLADSVSRWTCPYCTKVFSKFGYRHGRRHMGVDLPYPTGTPVKAAFDGRVRASMYYKGYGNVVVIRHENGLETLYGHLSRRDVKAGDWVRSGDIIGLGGSTGRSTGPHLHFETRYKGYAFDPQWIADFETGKLRKNVFILRRSYLSASSHYVPESIDEEEDVFGGDEKIIEEEKRIAAEKAARRYHTVKSGETISHICIKEHVSQAKIKQLNPGLNIDRISIGQKIRVN